MSRRSSQVFTFLLATAVPAAQVPAQAIDSATARVRPGAHYAAGSLHRWLFGRDYRDLWTAELEVPVLDLGRVAGGLTPTTAGGGFQTKSLRFQGADGYNYGFRSVDKDPSDVLPKEFEGTFIEDLVKDQTSSQHPLAPALMAPLMQAAGVLHTDPELVVMPDDPRLGKFRERFAGTLGFFERRATVEPGRPGFGGALEIIESDELFGRMQHGWADRVEVNTFLLARLLDVLVGDWDRHWGQWTWARSTDAPPRVWRPIPEDRDQAFSRYDGLMLGVARLAAPILQNFGPKYGNLVGATWNGRDVDRRLLTPVAWAAWDSLSRTLVARLTDSVIDAAVRRLPAAAYAIDGERMARTLKARRDRLPEFARRFYRLLRQSADLHATDAAESVAVDIGADGRVMVRIAERAAADTTPLLTAVFDPAVTGDLRIYVHGGDDVVRARGGATRMTVRVISEEHLRITNSAAAGIRIYGRDVAVDPAPAARRVHRSADVGPPPEHPFLSYRDWGSMWMPTWWLGYGPDVGVFLGAGVTRTGYGFRKYPAGSIVRFRAGWAFDPQRPRVDLDMTFHHENSRIRTGLYARASGIEVVRFTGLGNETALTQPDEYYRVRQIQYLLLPTIVFPLGAHGEIGLGPSIEYIKTRSDSGRIVAATQPYGIEGFGQVGGVARLQWDSRDEPAYPTRGVMLRVEGRVYPAVWDADSAYGSVEGAVSGYFTARIPLRPTLALRAGGKRAWGGFPFFQAAFLGDAASARLGRQNRYGGDASVFGNAELRLRLTRFFVILPGELGVFGLADAGRVFLEGESSDVWHSAFGGGMWISILRPSTVLSLAVARSTDRTAVYFGSGMAF